MKVVIIIYLFHKMSHQLLNHYIFFHWHKLFYNILFDLKLSLVLVADSLNYLYHISLHLCIFLVFGEVFHSTAYITT